MELHVGELRDKTVDLYVPFGFGAERDVVHRDSE
jgi:hypothetical protein